MPINYSSKIKEYYCDDVPYMGEDLKCVKYIDRGSYGIIFLYKDKKSKKKFAVKFVKLFKDNKSKTAQINNELYALQQMKVNGECHPNLLCMESYGYTSNSLYIISEYLEGINLNDFIKNYKVNMNNFLYISLQLMSGLKFLHSKDIGHADIKPDNIMINPKNNNVKIIDPGVACTKDYCSIHGSPLFMPPELLGDIENFSPISALTTDDVKKGDVFSLGLTLFMLYHKGKLPFGKKMSLRDIYDNYQIYNLSFSSGYKNIDEVLNSMLLSKPKKRWPIDKALKEFQKILPK